MVKRDELEAADGNVKTLLEKQNADLKKKVLSLSNKLRDVNNPGARKQYKTVEYKTGRPTEATIKTFQLQRVTWMDGTRIYANSRTGTK